MLILPPGGPVTFRNEPATSTSGLLRSRITRRCRVVAHVAGHLGAVDRAVLVESGPPTQGVKWRMPRSGRKTSRWLRRR